MSPSISALVCPHCQSRANFFAIEAPEHRSTGSLIFLTGGFLPYLFYASRRRQTVIGCGRCGNVFRPGERIPNAGDTEAYLIQAVLFGVPALAGLIFLIMRYLLLG